jgi:hypothetical protein
MPSFRPRGQAHRSGHPVPDEVGVAGTRASWKSNQSRDFYPAAGRRALSGRQNTLEDRFGPPRFFSIAARRFTKSMRPQTYFQSQGGSALGLSRISLILSDVVGDSRRIASGPTVPDSSSFADCLRVVERYELEEKIPLRVRAFLEAGARGEVEETPKAGDPIFQHVRNVIVGNNHRAGALTKPRGYNTLALSSCMVKPKSWRRPVTIARRL